jgi:prevent-host-death family protein
MRVFTTTELSKKSGEIITEALRHPVMLTQRGKERLIVMNVEDYQRLQSRGETRQAGRLVEMPDDLAEAFIEAAEAFGKGEDG